MDAKDIVQAIAEQFKEGEILDKFYDQSDDARREAAEVETFADEGIQDTDHGLTVYIGDRGFRITVEEF
jgi:hypothetical protein